MTPVEYSRSQTGATLPACCLCRSLPSLPPSPRCGLTHHRQHSSHRGRACCFDLLHSCFRLRKSKGLLGKGTGAATVPLFALQFGWAGEWGWTDPLSQSRPQGPRVHWLSHGARARHRPCLCLSSFSALPPPLRALFPCAGAAGCRERGQGAAPSRRHAVRPPQVPIWSGIPHPAALLGGSLCGTERWQQHNDGAAAPIRSLECSSCRHGVAAS